MAWIRQIPLEEAKGLLAREYRRALERAGRVWAIVGVMSLNPGAMKASMDLYMAIMRGRSSLTRVQRELLATVVSAEVGCRY